MNQNQVTLKLTVNHVEHHTSAGLNKGSVNERTKIAFTPSYSAKANLGNVNTNEISIWIDDPTIAAQFTPGSEYVCELIPAAEMAGHGAESYRRTA